MVHVSQVPGHVLPGARATCTFCAYVSLCLSVYVIMYVGMGNLVVFITETALSTVAYAANGKANHKTNVVVDEATAAGEENHG